MERKRETGSFRAPPATLPRGPQTSGSHSARLPVPAPSESARAALVSRSRADQSYEPPVLVPPSPTRSLRSLTTMPRPARPAAWHWSRPVAFACVLATLAAVLFVGAHQALLAGKGTTSTIIPPPSGRGPWTAFAGSVPIHTVPPPAPSAQHVINGLEPCHDTYMFLPSIWQWAVPPGCYSLIYAPNPKNYVSRPGFGYCNWWIRVTHPNHPDITENTSYPRGTRPAAGAPIFFDGGEQGAESIGHWAEAVAVSPDGYWVLISEMNFAWRGAGFGRLDYRYIHVSPHVHFVYIFS
jgi:hypothetical protein